MFRDTVDQQSLAIRISALSPGRINRVSKHAKLVTKILFVLRTLEHSMLCAVAMNSMLCSTGIGTVSPNREPLSKLYRYGTHEDSR